MESDQEIQNASRDIVSFTDSYVQNKQRKLNQQQESESTLSLAQVTSSLESLLRQIDNRKSYKQVIRIPKLLQSLIALVTFRLGTHLREEKDLLILKVRRQSRECLRYIQVYGDKQIQKELVNVGYGRVMSLSFSTAGGIGEEQDLEIRSGLSDISRFFRQLHEGRNNYGYRPFQPLPLLARVSLEQIEEEGANEEIEAQMNNNGLGGGIKAWGNLTKAVILNHFIHRHLS
ncbi:MAG: hypothetical protein EZS28_031485 [Streblomastix strix]|uniref:Uncharacterized protein n=1 Tax=Streblomastix strix TaxID=222440 RepID=A0A5J4URB5_9EUKA|nr:MAG: hypothetical protein EZS28_031485 [Streblomastix strix]